MTGILIGIGVSLLLFVVGFMLAPYLHKRGFINDQSVTQANQMIEIAKLILKNTKTGDEKTKEQIMTVFDISSIAVKYIEQTAKYKDNTVKKQMAKDYAISTLRTMNIEITEDLEKIIELGLESAVSLLPKTTSSETAEKFLDKQVETLKEIGKI